MRNKFFMRHIISGLILSASLALAESNPSPGNPPVIVPPTAIPNTAIQPNSGFNRMNPSAIQVFDADFFKDTPKPQQVNTTPKGRAYAEPAEYNTENRQRALEKCEALRTQDFAKYQECYKKDLANVKKGVQEGYDEVERRQSVPLRNAPNPIIEEQMRNPSGEEE